MGGMRLFLSSVAWVFLLFPFFDHAGADSGWATEEEAEALAAEMRSFFAGAEERRPGSVGNLAMEERVLDRFSGSGFKHGEIRFRAPVFLPGETRVLLQGHPPLRLFPMHPTLFRPGNFRQREFSADLVYLGRGTMEDLDNVEGTDLDGSIAVMEFDCMADWLWLLRFGIQGFVFIGAENYHHSDSLGKVYGTEVSVPRFFIPPEEGARLREILAGGRGLRARVEAAPSRWENRELRDLWVLVPGVDEDLSKEVIAITAPIDGNCVVPGLAGGAQSGANLFLLMRLLEEFRENAPARTVLLGAINAHTHYFCGERVLAWSLLSPVSKLEALQDLIAADLRVQEMFVERYGKLNLNPPTEDDEEYIIKMRKLVDDSTGKHLTVKEPIVNLAKRNVNLLKTEQLRMLREDLSREAQRAGIDSMVERRQKYVNVLTLFNKVGIKTKLSELTAEETEILRGYVKKVIETNRAWAELNRRDLEINTANSRVREALEGRNVKLVLTLEFVWTGNRIGFSAGDLWGSERWAHRWGVNTAAIAASLDKVKAGAENLYVDAITKRGGLPESHFFREPAPAVSFFHAANQTPAFAARNVYSDFGLAFSPGDTLDNLPKACVTDIMNCVPVLLRAMLENRDLTAPSELLKPHHSRWRVRDAWAVQLKAFKFDEFSASVLPELPVSDSVVILQQPAGRGVDPVPSLVSGDVINRYMALTDGRAASVFVGIVESKLSSSAFHFDPDFGRVDHAVDAGEIAGKMEPEILNDDDSIMLALFRCEEFPVYVRHDSSTISVLPIRQDSYLLLSGKLNSAPKKYGTTGANSLFSARKLPLMEGPAAFYFEPGDSPKLLTASKTLMLNASEKVPTGIGFDVSERTDADFFRQAARDMAFLNHDRLSKLRGISDELAMRFLKHGDEQLGKMEQARARNDYVGYLKALYEGLGAQFKAYFQTTSITNDMLKAVVFYLALMLPFCFLVEKLVFKFVKIEVEMLVFGSLFVLTFVVFRMIHPAFRIAKAPEAIFIAFVMGGLGAFVIKILHDRFEGEMQLLFNTYVGMDTGEVGYSTVGQEAMLIGVNNMKRRRLRTTFTTATIVLVTFTMLAFTSISKKLSPTLIHRSEEAPYTGLMYHWPGNSRMDEATMRVFVETFSDSGEVIVRRWLLPKSYRGQNVPFHVSSSTGEEAQIDAGLGLAAAESGFIGEIPMRAGRFFARDDGDEVILTSALAKALRIDADDFAEHSIRFQNRDLKIAGILRDENFRMIEDLNQRPLLPIKSLLKQAAGQEDMDMSAAKGKTPEETGIFYVDMPALLILPVDTAKRVGAEPYSVSVRLKRDVPIWAAVDRLLTITRDTKFFVSSVGPFPVGSENKKTAEAGVYYVGEGYRTSIGGMTFLIIPLLIASTIILNTMLGSVFERKSEIAVYNAVGLNPTHIGMFFLAESFVYSVIGSVGGYLIGQMLSILLTKTGIIEEINLNFSSLSVVYVILFTIAVVLLSTIYPSMVATKAAVPSGKRKWSLPAADGHTMNVVFPFIYQYELIPGIVGYLDEYFSRFTEASFGDLIAVMEKKEAGKDEKGRDVYTIQYHVALAPFDLGVTQGVVFSAAFDERVDAYRIVMKIERISGQDTNWKTTNKPFLEKIRTYLLHWRNLDAAEHALYVQRGTQLFSSKQPETPGVPG